MRAFFMPRRAESGDSAVIVLGLGARWTKWHSSPSLVMTPFIELLEGSHHVCSGYRLRLTSVLHPSLYKLLYKLLGGVHSAVSGGTETPRRSRLPGL